jgi:hypothetical protein
MTGVFFLKLEHSDALSWTPFPEPEVPEPEVPEPAEGSKGRRAEVSINQIISIEIVFFLLSSQLSAINYSKYQPPKPVLTLGANSEFTGPRACRETN